MLNVGKSKIIWQVVRLGFAYAVHNALGPGLLERAYQEALCVELKLQGIPFER